MTVKEELEARHVALHHYLACADSLTRSGTLSQGLTTKLLQLIKEQEQEIVDLHKELQIYRD